MRRKIQALSAHFYRNAQNCTDCVSDGYNVGPYTKIIVGDERSLTTQSRK